MPLFEAVNLSAIMWLKEQVCLISSNLPVLQLKSLLDWTVKESVFDTVGTF